MSKIRRKIRTRLFIADRWVDVTDQVLQRDKIKIGKGRENENTEQGPLTSLFTLKNDQLQWSPGNPLSPYTEDLKRNMPVAQELVLAEDDFDRSSSAGLGTCPTGQPWVSFASGGVISATDVSISGGLARFSVPAVSSHRSAALVDEALYNAAAECTFQLPTSNVTGGNVEPANLLLRVRDSNTTYYMARVVVTASDTVTVAIHAFVTGTEFVLTSAVTVSGLTNTGQRMRVKFWVEGMSLFAKVWDESTGEPLAHNVSIRDTRITQPGSVGIRCGVAAANTNTLPFVFAVDDFTFYSPRFIGEMSSMVLGDNEKGSDRHVKCQAAGPFRRLGQGSEPIMSSLRRGYLNIGSTLINYWPCEDGTDADSIASALGQAPMHLVGSPDFAANNDFPCSKPVPELNNSAWFGDVPSYTFTGEIQCRVLVSISSSAPPPNETVLIRLFGAGTVRVWELLYLTGGNLMVKGFDAADVEIFTTGSMGFAINDIPLRLSLELENSGADVLWFVGALSVAPGAIGGFVNGTLAGYNCGAVQQVMAGPQGIGDRVALGHISLESNRTDLFANVRELNAWYGETSSSRMSRLAQENGLAFTHLETDPNDSALMGFQRPVSLLSALREAERTDGGVLHEPRNYRNGLEYRSRATLYAQTARLTADISAKQVNWPFRPRVDDQLTRNDVTVEQPDGSSARAEQTTGPMSTAAYPSGIGRIDTSVSVNTSSTSLLPNHAQWRLALGVTPDPRTPGVILNMESKEIAPLLRNALDLMLGDKIEYTNAGERTGYYDTLSQIVLSINEEWTNHEGKFTVTAAPEGPYAVGVLDGTARLDSGSSTLNGALSAGNTGTFSVATSDPGDLWITTATHQPDVYGTNHFPVDVMIGGEKITISSITGASSPQTFTIAANGRGVNGVHESGAVGKAHPSGAEVHPYEPFRFGL